MMANTQTSAEVLGMAAVTRAELGSMTSAATGRPECGADVRATPVDYSWGSPATAGLWQVDVLDADGTVVDAFFVKLLRHTRLWPGLKYLPDDASRAEFVDFFPWRAELDMHESGIGAVLPHGMRTPVLHHVKYADADHIALWWEFVPQRPGPWRSGDYQRAAYLLGRLAARRKEGAVVNQALPAVARIRHPDGSALRYFTKRRVYQGALPALRDQALWRHPVVAAALQRTGDPALPGELQALGDRLPQILDLLDTLPQAHAHGDASPQNLLLPANEPETVVVIDWGFATLLPVGFDLGQLLAGLAQAGQGDPGDLAAIDPVIFGGYMAGLDAEGYEVEPAVVRTGYLGGLAARSALCTLPLELLSNATATDETVDRFVHGLRLGRVLADLAAQVPVGSPA
jgi:Phosphotransferase enzyme family